ncbi:hypothetical protein Lgra_2270 [Legionella gratiana]|uniref:DUF3757 domain-containing protein n=1 Tax=Legionella gratiana TaxID=45066 RepID=A0A378JD78_9GAMM|nr:hypothetical protein [Legionella gratiana]KTD09035.1 hypothetical protein Lgra_2270 [Legionella gratiana]STX45752.1 Uncharacterised protein [Legionella gratiana]
MKKGITFCVLYGITMLAYAKTCPTVNELLVKAGRNYYVVPPSGWKLVVNDKSPSQKNLVFRVAAWGDHKHPSDNVRCHYYHGVSEDHVQLETVEFIEESRIPWGGADHYQLCVSRSDNVNECQFG